MVQIKSNKNSICIRFKLFFFLSKKFSFSNYSFILAKLSLRMNLSMRDEVKKNTS